MFFWGWEDLSDSIGMIKDQVFFQKPPIFWVPPFMEITHLMWYSPNQPNGFSRCFPREIPQFFVLANRWSGWCREWCRWKSPLTKRASRDGLREYWGYAPEGVWKELSRALGLLLKKQRRKGLGSPRHFQTNPHGCKTHDYHIWWYLMVFFQTRYHLHN